MSNKKLLTPHLMSDEDAGQKSNVFTYIINVKWYESSMFFTYIINVKWYESPVFFIHIVNVTVVSFFISRQIWG
jgi:hypothetical protein